MLVDPPKYQPAKSYKISPGFCALFGGPSRPEPSMTRLDLATSAGKGAYARIAEREGRVPRGSDDVRTELGDDQLMNP